MAMFTYGRSRFSQLQPPKSSRFEIYFHRPDEISVKEISFKIYIFNGGHHAGPAGLDPVDRVTGLLLRSGFKTFPEEKLGIFDNQVQLWRCDF